MSLFAHWFFTGIEWFITGLGLGLGFVVSLTVLGLIVSVIRGFVEAVSQ